jgi:small subunit ribosomal protein S20
MPKTKSAKKALRQNKTHHARNKARKIHIKTEVKEFRKLIAEKKMDDAKKALPKVMKIVDKMAKVGFIKKKKADRIKSRLSKKLNVK